LSCRFPRRYAFNTNPKKHHFLPQFYLRGFSREDHVCLYDREKREYRRQKPINIAFVKHFYTTALEGGESDTLVEEMLSRIEGQAKPIIDDLISGKHLTLTQRFRLSRFLGFLFTRTPKFDRETTQLADQTHKQIAKELIPTVEAAARVLEKSGNDTFVTAESFFDFIHKERFQITGHRNIVLDFMMKHAQEASKGLFSMNWEVVHAPSKRAFITSDAPFGYIVPDNLKDTDRPILGILSEEILKVIPLSPEIALRIGAYGLGFSHVVVDRRELAKINLAVAKECDRFLIGTNEDSVRFVVERSRIDETQTGTRLKIESVTHPTDPNRSFFITHRVSAENASRPFNPENLRGVT